MNINTVKCLTRLLRPLTKIRNMTHHSKKGQRVILMYHGVSKLPRFNCVTRDLLEEEISWLKDRYSIVSLSVLVEELASASAQEEADLASITFDDGYVNFAELALPILQKHGCHATLFVPVQKMGGYNDWDENRAGFCKMSIMSFKELRQLPKEFVETGSHGLAHTRLDQRLSYDQIAKEIIQSRLKLEQDIGSPVRFFAFPFGVYPWGPKSRALFDEKYFLSGYLAACTSLWGRHNSIKDIYRLRRIGIWQSDSFGDFVDKLNGFYDWLGSKETIGRFLKMIWWQGSKFKLPD